MFLVNNSNFSVGRSGVVLVLGGSAKFPQHCKFLPHFSDQLNLFSFVQIYLFGRNPLHIDRIMVDGLSRDADVNTMNSNRTNSLDFETCFDPEFVLRALFDQIIFVESLDSQPPNWPTTDIVIHFVPGPSPNEVAAEFSDILSHWIWKLCGGSHANANDKSRNQVDMLICKILNEKIPISKGSSDLLNIKGLGSIDPPLLLPPLSYDSSQRKYEQGRRAVVAMLVWLRKVVALDPGGMSQSFDFRDPEELKWQKLVLSTRKALLQMTQNCLDEGDIPKKVLKKFGYIYYSKFANQKIGIL